MRGSQMTRGRQENGNSNVPNLGFRGTFRVAIEKLWTYVNVVEYKHLVKMTILLRCRFLFRRSTWMKT